MVFRPKSSFSAFPAISLSLTQRVVLVMLAAILVSIFVAGSWVTRRVTDNVLVRNADGAAHYMAEFLEPLVQGLARSDRLTPDAKVALDKVANDFSLRRHVHSIKVWTRDGTVVYATDRSIVGKSFPTTEISDALAGRVSAYFDDLSVEDDPAETSSSVPLYEIYVPLISFETGEVIAVGEFYENATTLREQIQSSALETWIVIGTGGVVVLALLAAVVARGSRTISAQRLTLARIQNERSTLEAINEGLEAKASAVSQNLARVGELVQRRIGVELHDGPTQSLSYILMRIDDLAKVPHSEADAVRARETVAGVRDAAANALKELREISSGLFLDQADRDNARPDGMSAVILAHELRTGLPVRQQGFEHLVDIPENVMRVAAQVVREALTNAYKHAGGAGQTVRIERRDDHLTVEVSDTGPGMAIAENGLPEAKAGHLGLAGMRYRIEEIGGTLSVKSERGKGTKMTFSFPLDSPSTQG